MYKVVVVNFKNLIDEDEAISTKTMLLIDNLRRKKYKFVIVTEKSYEEILLYNTSFPFIDYIISYNGSIVYDTNKNKCLVNKNLSSKESLEITKIFNKYELVNYEQNAKVYQIKIKNISEKSFQNLISQSNLAINYYQIGKDFYLTSSKINEATALEKLIKNKKDLFLSVVPYSEADYNLLDISNNNYFLKTSDIKLKRLLKEKKHYIIEENINKILTNLDI